MLYCQKLIYLCRKCTSENNIMVIFLYHLSHSSISLICLTQWPIGLQKIININFDMDFFLLRLIFLAQSFNAKQNLSIKTGKSYLRFFSRFFVIFCSDPCLLQLYKFVNKLKFILLALILHKTHFSIIKFLRNCQSKIRDSSILELYQCPLSLPN